MCRWGSRHIDVWFARNTPNLWKHHLLEHINQDKKKGLNKYKDSTVNKTEYWSKRNPTGKPRWAWQQPKHQTVTILSIDKSLSRNHHRVWSPTHRRAIKEESKNANRDGVDHQACSLLQYITVIANLFIMGNYFNELRWKIIRANNLLQFVHQVTIELRFLQSLAQERFKSILEFRYQIIVSFIKFRKCFAKFMILIALFKKILS